MRFPSIKTFPLTISIFLLWIWITVDGCLNFIDSGFVALALFASAIIMFGCSLIFLFSKKKRKSLNLALFASATILGFFAGKGILAQQYSSTLNELNHLIVELEHIREKESKYPHEIPETLKPNSSYTLPIGFLRKRKLCYSVSEDGTSYELWFVHFAFMITYYNSETKQWLVDD